MWKNPTSSQVVCKSLKLLGPFKRHARSLPIKEALSKTWEIIWLPSLKLIFSHLQMDGWKMNFLFGMAQRVFVMTISCVVGGTFYTFSQQTWISWPSYIVYQGQESTSPNQPTELLVGSLSIWIYLGCWKTHFFQTSPEKIPRLQRWLSWTRLICFRQMLGLRSYHEVGFNLLENKKTSNLTRAVRCWSNLHNLLKWPRSNMLAANWLHRYSLTRWFALCFRNDWSKWHIMMQQY